MNSIFWWVIGGVLVAAGATGQIWAAAVAGLLAAGWHWYVRPYTRHRRCGGLGCGRCSNGRIPRLGSRVVHRALNTELHKRGDI